MIGTTDQDNFVSEHRWAVLTTLRHDGSPSASVVAYARQGDELVVSTRSIFFKVRSIDRDQRVSLTVISNAEPFNFVTVEGTAAIERGDVLDATRAVFANLAAINYPAPPDLRTWIEEQGRVIIRITPARVSGVVRRR